MKARQQIILVMRSNMEVADFFADMGEYDYARDAIALATHLIDILEKLEDETDAE